MNQPHQFTGYIRHGAMAIAFSVFTLTKLNAQTIIPIETARNALVLEANAKKDVNTIFFGKKLADKQGYTQVISQYKQTEDYTGQLNSVYTPSGSRNLVEPAISVTHADGNNSLDLKYVDHTVTKIDDNVSLLKIRLKDPVYNFEVTLFYKSFYKQDVIEQWTEIKHSEKGTVILNKYASANLHLKSPHF